MKPSSRWNKIWLWISGHHPSQLWKKESARTSVTFPNPNFEYQDYLFIWRSNCLSVTKETRNVVLPVAIGSPRCSDTRHSTIKPLGHRRTTLPNVVRFGMVICSIWLYGRISSNFFLFSVRPSLNINVNLNQVLSYKLGWYTRIYYILF